MLKFLSVFFRSIKNIVIVVLIALAVLQTGQLWFVNITNRSFIPAALLPLSNNNTQQERNEIVKPYRVISGTGGGRFNISYGSLSNAPAIE